MPSIKIPRKSTDVDMTPFVDVAFLILTFFIMATKFKPPEPIEITTPNSVSTKALPDNDAILVSMGKDGRVFFSILADAKPEVKDAVIKNLNTTRNLGLTDREMLNFRKAAASGIGVPFSKLKSLLSVSSENYNDVVQEGIPVKDSATAELRFWIRDAVNAFAASGARTKLNYLVKGDNDAKYPEFKKVLEAFKWNDIYKFNLVTMPEDAPMGTDLYKKLKNPAPKPAATKAN